MKPPSTLTRYHSTINLLSFIALILAATAASFAQKAERLALTPPMGWNSWNFFGCNVNEQLIRETADAMVASGMKDVGYRYINIDDCWHGTRDSLGFIHPDPQRFPSGMKALADYVHARGLKLGIYSDVGNQTCGGRPGSRGHEYQDAITYAQWGIDYLKYDWCASEGLNPVGAYTTMRDALHASGRDIVFSICEWGSSAPWRWAKEVGHLWRTTGDISPFWDSIVDHKGWYSWGVLQILERQDSLRPYAGPGHWNDPDMLEVGNGMKLSEDRAHFSLWCMLAAPLMSGNDLRHMSKETAGVLTNRDVIAVNQDSLGIQALKYSARDGLETWFKPLRNGDWAACFLNLGAGERDVTVAWKDFAVQDSVSGKNTDFNSVTYSIQDLWTKKNLGNTRKPLKTRVSGHDVLMVRLRKM